MAGEQFSLDLLGPIILEMRDRIARIEADIARRSKTPSSTTSDELICRLGSGDARRRQPIRCGSSTA